MERERALSRPLLHRPSSSDSDSTYGVPMSLNLGQKVFLSHSGRDKQFVRFLYKELCRQYGDKIAFFDAETLPKATPVSMDNILEEAKGSKLGVLVLTDDFFIKTPNPMRELEAFVDAKVQLLPLFCKMSVDEFREKSRRAMWEEHWKNSSAKELGGRRVEEVIEKWRYALNMVITFSGLEYGKVANNEPEYVEKIVKEVTRIIPPTILFSEEGVCGKDRLCQIVNNMYKECASKRLPNDHTIDVASTYTYYSPGEDTSYKTLDVVGIYGFPGIGKTTLCKCLCDFYFPIFNGKVCYVDIGSLHAEQGSFQKHSLEAFTIFRMQHMLPKLTNYKNDDFSSLNIYQVKRLLREELSLVEDPIFLALDINILHPDLELKAREEVDFYLSCEFPKGSMIFITSRSPDILKILTSQYSKISVVIDYMPALEFKEARDIFVHEIPKLVHNIGILNVEDEVKKCVKMCILDLKQHMTHYHPLMLKSLAAFVRWEQDWKGILRKLGSEGSVDKNDPFKKVFTMLDSTFAILSKEAQTLFLDFVLFYSVRGYLDGWIRRLYSRIHNDRINEIFLQLQNLCFIEKDLQTPVTLLVDFCRYKITQGDYAQYYEVVESGAQWRAEIPRTVRYVSISGCGYDDRARTYSLDLRHLEALEVLHLVDNVAGVLEVLLSSTTCAQLRSLIVRVPRNTSLRFVMDENWSSLAVRQPHHQGRPHMLFWLELQGNVSCESLQPRFKRIQLWWASNVGYHGLQHLAITAAPVVMDLGSSVLGELRNLEYLSLSELPTFQSINVASCSNQLKELRLQLLPSLWSIGGLDKLASLESLVISYCEQLRMLTIPDVSWCTITSCPSLESVSLCTLLSNPGAYSSTIPGNSSWINLTECISVRNIDGLQQYSGEFSCNNGSFNLVPARESKILRDLLESAGIDSSICKGSVTRLSLSGRPLGLVGAEAIELEDVRHSGLLISALVNAQLQHLRILGISCEEGVDCGCGKINVPESIGPLRKTLRKVCYHCPQVRDLASLAQCDVVEELDLSGCTSVEVWPDFAAMTSLQWLDLSFTSLRELPTSLLRLHDLTFLEMRGCRQLPAEELMKVICYKRGNVRCIEQSFLSLLDDVQYGRRDRCLVADALDSHYAELVALFHRSYLSEEVVSILDLMYEVWFDKEGKAAPAGSYIRTKMGRLLCCESFLSFPFLTADSPEFLFDKHMKLRCQLEAVALIGVASIGWYKAAVNHDLKDNFIIPFLQSYAQNTELGSEFWDWKLRERVEEAVCKMARVASVAAALGEDFINTLQFALFCRLSF